MHSRFMSECTYPTSTCAVKRKNLNRDQRKEFLDNDEWVADTDLHSVVCKGCERNVALDGRNGHYYLNFWVKHRSRCPTVYVTWLQKKGMVPDADKEWFRKHNHIIEQA
ncbi:hypothetical protein IW261DRAFT_1512586 [Armillaria novae-zelandiae]|uniref:Uncharacterized protein n=1 Tax=Armillaria novae-zelandiae TaxID=153914 RepID=A0AA39UA94_9AGAR|nr:hypothetical protein IW261DRAFT_1512586 [Armillaria novae-zelandiae]